MLPLLSSYLGPSPPTQHPSTVTPSFSPGQAKKADGRGGRTCVTTAKILWASFNCLFPLRRGQSPESIRWNRAWFSANKSVQSFSTTSTEGEGGGGAQSFERKQRAVLRTNTIFIAGHCEHKVLHRKGRAQFKGKKES